MSHNILIVDDESASLELLQALLVAEGYRVRSFNHPEMALCAVAADVPELIVLDVRMPDMDGLEACQQLKNQHEFKDIPIIFMGSAHDLDDKVAAFQAGGVDYITKPFQKEEVVARVRTQLTLSHSLKEIKRIAEVLLKSEANLKIAQAIAHLGYWEWDVQAGMFCWSEEAYRIFGFEPQDFPQDYDTFLSIVHPEDRERVAASLYQLSCGSSFDIEYRIVLPNNEIRVVHCKSQMLNLKNDAQPTIVGTVQYFPEHDQETILGIIQDITEHKKLEWQLEQQANTDCLTGCANRRFFLEKAEQEILRIRRYGGDLSIMALDLDHFKAINDEYGHHAGDLTLKKLVEICRSQLRDVDVVGRFGGEEFVVMLPETSLSLALDVARRLVRVVEATLVVLPTERSPLHFTTSIGVASLSDPSMPLEVLLQRADQALYQAKHEGRNRVCAG